MLIRSRKKKKLTYNEKKEWQTIEDDIASIEQRISEIPEEMAQNGTNYVLLGDLQKELDSLNEDLEEKMNRWEYLSEIVEGL